MNQTSKTRGFTLVELLVVIAIIGILAGLVFSIGRGMLLKSQIKGTHATIIALSAACDQYRSVFYAYPDLLATAPSNATNTRLRTLMEETVYTVDEVRHDPFISSPLPAENNLYIDAWGNPLYIGPGRDHSGDTPKGPNNLDPRQPTRRTGTPLDIYSAGYNSTLENGLTGATATTWNSTDSDDIVSWLMDTKYVEETIHSRKKEQ